MSTNTKTNDVRMFRVRPARVALACGVMLTWPATANDRNPVDPPLPRVIENAMLRISFPDDPSSGTGSRFEVLDKRSGRVWRTAAAGGKAAGFLLKGNTASFDLMLPQHPDGYRAVFTLEPDRPELTVELQGPAETRSTHPSSIRPPSLLKRGDGSSCRLIKASRIRSMSRTRRREFAIITAATASAWLFLPPQKTASCLPEK
jgi:hypothetical protein